MSKSGSVFTDEHYITGLTGNSGAGMYEFTAPGDFSATALPVTATEYLGVACDTGFDRDSTSGSVGVWWNSTSDIIGNGAMI